MLVLSLAALSLSGIFRCPLALLFGVPCPMCGGTRAMLALASFHPLTALRFNALAPVVALLALGLAARGAYLHANEGHTRRLLDGAGRILGRALVVAFVLALLVWALRFLGLFGGPCPV